MIENRIFGVWEATSARPTTNRGVETPLSKHTFWTQDRLSSTICRSLSNRLVDTRRMEAMKEADAGERPLKTFEKRGIFSPFSLICSSVQTRLIAEEIQRPMIASLAAKEVDFN